jgi:hypothetical protein
MTGFNDWHLFLPMVLMTGIFFYRNNPSPNKQQLLDQATAIDDQFGYLFNPPVR